MRIVRPRLGAPILQTEGWIRENNVESFEAPVASKKTRLAKRVLAQDPRILKIMQVEVHPPNGGCRQIDLLPVEAHLPRLATRLDDLVRSLDQHATRTTRRVVDRIARLGIENPRQRPHDITRCEELTRLLARLVRELLQQVLVRITKQVVRDLTGSEIERGERLDQIEQRRLRQLIAIRPRRIAKDARERLRVRLLDAIKDLLQREADILVCLEQISPVTPVRHIEAVKIRLNLAIDIITKFGDGLGVFLQPGIVNALQKQERKDELLEIRGIHRAAETIGGRPQARFEFLLRHAQQIPPPTR